MDKEVLEEGSLACLADRILHMSCSVLEALESCRHSTGFSGARLSTKEVSSEILQRVSQRLRHAAF